MAWEVRAELRGADPALGLVIFRLLIGSAPDNNPTLRDTGSFKIGVSCRDAARPPPWSRWSSSSRSRPWKRPLGCDLSAYEDARLRQPAHERRASVTAGFAYERVSRVNRSRPFPCYGRGRERHVGRGAGACPATAHWRAVGTPTKVRSSHRASNSVPFRLILTMCLPLLLSLCASGSLAGASRCARGPPPAPSWLAGAVGPWTLPPTPLSRR